MSDNLARIAPPDDEQRFHSKEPVSESVITPVKSRTQARANGSAPAIELNEDEIIVDAGMWVVFNRRILMWINRKNLARQP